MNTQGSTARKWLEDREGAEQMSRQSMAKLAERSIRRMMNAVPICSSYGLPGNHETMVAALVAVLLFVDQDHRRRCKSRRERRRRIGDRQGSHSNRNPNSIS